MYSEKMGVQLSICAICKSKMYGAMLEEAIERNKKATREWEETKKELLTRLRGRLLGEEIISTHQPMVVETPKPVVSKHSQKMTKSQKRKYYSESDITFYCKFPKCIYPRKYIPT